MGEQILSQIGLFRREGVLEAKDGIVFVVVMVIDDAVDMSLIKSLLSYEGEVRVVICNAESNEDDDGVGDGSRCSSDKHPLRFYTNKKKVIQ